MSWRRLLLCLATVPQIVANSTSTTWTSTSTTTEVFCAIVGCRDFNEKQECQCNTNCEDRGDCCSDFQAVCLPKTLNASCEDYGCGGYSGSQDCQCDSECIQEQTCCFDFDDVCGGNASNASDEPWKKHGTRVDWNLCNAHFEPPSPAQTVVELNGVRLPDTCINSTDEHRVFIIGDWGGLASGDPEKGPATADHRKSGFHKRDYVDGLDDRAQQRVADRMKEGAARLHPDYIINVGDNFYWGGVEQQCCATRLNMSNFSTQWDEIFEDIYTGDAIDGLQWLGVLGNHDYGGYFYNNAWDQNILYTWKDRKGEKPSRWVTPALYWRSTVHYANFSVEYFFLDTNIFDAFDPFTHMGSNICSYAYNEDIDCSAEGGPSGIFDCKPWFDQLWQEQLEWLHLHLSNSSADWQIVVTHFPPVYAPVLFRSLSDDYGIDAFLTGHLHRQEVHGNDDTNFLAPTVWVVSGGGGGITSDYMPHLDGDSQYGYMIMTLTKDRLEIVNIDHAGNEGDKAVASPRHCRNCSREHVQRNLQRYKDGLEVRGRLADRTVTTTTSARASSAQSADTATTTIPAMPAAQEIPFGWWVLALFAALFTVASLGGAITKFSKSRVDWPGWPSRSGYDGLGHHPADEYAQNDAAKQSLIAEGRAQTESSAEYAQNDAAKQSLIAEGRAQTESSAMDASDVSCQLADPAHV